MATNNVSCSPWSDRLTLFIFLENVCQINSHVWITIVCQTLFEVKMVLREKAASAAHSLMA